MKKYIILIIFSCLLMGSVFAQNKPLKISIAHFIPPYVMESANKQTFGFDIDMMRYICKQMKRECEFTSMPFKDILPTLENDKADMAVSAIAITASRSERVLFSMPYLPSYATFLTHKNTIKKYGENLNLNQLRIGVVTGTVFVEQLELMGLSQGNIVLYASEEISIEALAKNKVDLIFEDQPTADFWHMRDDNLILWGKQVPYGFGLGIAVNPRNPELVKEINDALNQFLNGPAFKTTYDTYFGAF